MSVSIEQFQNDFDIIFLDFPPVNALSPAVVDHFRYQLKSLRDSNNPLLIVSKNEKIFSGGFDLRALLGLQRDEMRAFLKNFNALLVELFLFPRKTSCLLNGACHGAGTLVAMACDVVLFQGSEKSKIGLPEWSLGLTLTYTGLSILKFKISYPLLLAWCRVPGGLPAPRLIELGLVQSLDFKGALLSMRDEDETLAPIGHDLGLLKRGVLPADTAAEDETYLDFWFQPATQKKLLELITAKKPGAKTF